MKKEEENLEIEWKEAPLYMSCKDIIKLGFKKNTIYKWFHSKDFPTVIKQGGYRVNKYKLKNWLENMEESTWNEVDF